MTPDTIGQPAIARLDAHDYWKRAVTARRIADADSLSPARRVVLDALLTAHRTGLCRGDFARLDIWEPSKRLGELRRFGWSFWSEPCRRHDHRNPRTLRYYVAGWTDGTVTVELVAPR